MEKNRLREIGIHLSAVFLFLSLPFVFAPAPPGSRSFLEEPRTWHELFSSLIMLLYFYANVFVFIPRFYFRKKYVAFALAGLFFLLAVALLPPLLPAFHGHPEPPRREHGWDFLLLETGHRIFLFAATLLFSLMLEINTRWRQTRREKKDAELAYLRAQINPHFLFNTLNGIYALSLEKSDKTPEAVVKLSGMMRYVLDESQKDRVSLDRELAYIGDYIALQKIRLGETARVSYTHSGDTAGKRVAPLLLIPFVENAFKHGVNTETVSDIVIHVQIEGNRLSLEVFNAKTGVPFTGEKSGLGIENTRSRLHLLYPQRYELIIRDGDKKFSVVLNLLLA